MRSSKINQCAWMRGNDGAEKRSLFTLPFGNMIVTSERFFFNILTNIYDKVSLINPIEFTMNDALLVYYE